jgi:PKD repeat protein
MKTHLILRMTLWALFGLFVGTNGSLLPNVPNIPYEPLNKLTEISENDPLPEDEFWFVVYSDGEYRSWLAENMTTMFTTMLDMNPLPVIAIECGDLVPEPNREEFWIGFENYGGLFREFRQRIAYWPTVGNHDCDPGGWDCDMYLEFFELPKVYATDYGYEALYNQIVTEKVYSFDYKNAHFLTFNPFPREGTRFNDEKGTGPIIDFVRDDLSNTDKKFIFTFAHHNIDQNWTADYEELGIFEEYQVTAHFAGDEHKYQRINKPYTTFITATSPTDPGDIPSFIRVHVTADYAEAWVMSLDGNTVLDHFTMTSNRPDPTLAARISANPISGNLPLTVNFDGSDSTDPDGTIVTYEWDFNDGFWGSGETFSHTYQVAGTYIVTLTVTDNNGNQDTDSITINVKPSIRGDLNEDGVVNEEDFHLCAKVVLGFETSTEVLSNADLNLDGNVDVLDIQTIANILMK